MIPRTAIRRAIGRRLFASTKPKCTILDASNLQDRIVPKYEETSNSDLMSLRWPSPPRNIFMVSKDGTPSVTENLIEYVKHISSNYGHVSLIFEPSVATQVHEAFQSPIFAASSPGDLPDKVDMVTTLGGDGTILHAASLFNTTLHVPPILSFSMGTLGFLGEWKFSEYKRAFREVYMSGADNGSPLYQEQKESSTEAVAEETSPIMTGWSSLRGKCMGPTRSSRVLLRNRLKVGVFDADGDKVVSDNTKENTNHYVHALNEVIIHRGKEAHLAIIEVFVGGRFLTEAVADGMIISTPTGSTAYSLSSGGNIVHPLVSSLLLTPICPRSLSFRPLVLPANTPITLRLSEKNRGRELEVSIDGKRESRGVGVGMEIRVIGEEMVKGPLWHGGVPCVMRGSQGGVQGDDGWVGGLNGLLKFNHSFGEE